MRVYVCAYVNVCLLELSCCYHTPAVVQPSCTTVEGPGRAKLIQRARLYKYITCMQRSGLRESSWFKLQFSLHVRTYYIGAAAIQVGGV
jgi:hypothetical protein